MSSNANFGTEVQVQYQTHTTIYLVQSILIFIHNLSSMYLYFYSFIMFDLNST